MRAAVFYGKGDIRTENYELRPLQDGEVLVKVMACGVCGTDLHIFAGAKGAAECTPPTILGHEFAGEIAEVGSGVTRVKKGDRVCVNPNDACGSCYYCQTGKEHFCEHMKGIGTTMNGGFAQYCIIPEKQAYKIADGLEFCEGAMTEPTACCLNGIDRANIKAGSHVLIIGGGTIGQLMLRLAKIAGAATVSLIEPTPWKRELALKTGAFMAFAPDAEDITGELKAAGVYNLDVVIECVGLKSTMEQAIELAGNAATVVLFGLTDPDAVMGVKPYDIFRKELTVTSSYINPYTHARAVDLLSSGTLKVRDLITDEVSIENIEEVFNNKEYRTHGKIVICPWK